MKKNKAPYRLFQLASASFMIVALLWLTISAPFVLAGKKQLAGIEKTGHAATSSGDHQDEETSNPFGNSTEEKSVGNGAAFSEEYLHDHHINEHFFTITTHYPKCEDADTYTAFHGELLVPPPNIA